MRNFWVLAAVQAAGVGLCVYGLWRWSLEVALIVLGLVLVIAAERWS